MNLGLWVLKSFRNSLSLRTQVRTRLLPRVRDGKERVSNDSRLGSDALSHTGTRPRCLWEIPSVILLA